MTVSIHKIRVRFLIACDSPTGTEFAGLFSELHNIDERVVDTYTTVGNVIRRIVEADFSATDPEQLADSIAEVQATIKRVVEGYGNPKSTLFYCANCDTQTNSIADLTGDRHVGCTEGYGVWFAVDAEKMEMEQQNEQS